MNKEIKRLLYLQCILNNILLEVIILISDELVIDMRYINSESKMTTKSLKRPDLSYMHLYLVLLTLFSIVKPAEGCSPGYYYDSGHCLRCQPGRYKPYYSYGSSCTLCAAGKYSRYVSSTSTCAPTITATHILILYMLLLIHQRS